MLGKKKTDERNEDKKFVKVTVQWKKRRKIGLNVTMGDDDELTKAHLSAMSFVVVHKWLVRP